jgi:membrane-associated PAP2 superfamily phosphatase
MRSATSPLTPGQIWLHHVRWPATAFLLSVFLLALTHADPAIARAFFFDASVHAWRGAGVWWVNAGLHTAGGWIVRGMVVLALALWCATFFDAELRRLRRATAYFALAVVLTAGAVGLLKTLTNVDCPWDLQLFGGRFPYIELFARRPATLPRAQCFPAAHASTGYALMALYFVAREWSRKWAVLGLGAGLLTGLAFGLAQQARGAHFVSHDLWSAFFAWIIPLTLYAFAFNGRLYERTEPWRDSWPRASSLASPGLPPGMRLPGAASAKSSMSCAGRD